MHTLDIQLPGAGRRRGRYSNEFKLQLMAACKQPGVSTAAVALANGLNANLLRRWISESRLPAAKAKAAKQTKPLALATQTQFTPLELQSSATPVTIQIELQRSDTIIRVQWPVACADECAAWMREVLK